MASAQSPADGFDPGANDKAYAVAVQPDGKIVVGGMFTMLGGGGTGTTLRNRVGRLNTDGSVDSDFNPGAGANLPVNTLALQPDGKIVVAGYFTTLGGLPRERIGRLNPGGSIDAPFDPPGANAPVWALAVQPDGKILVGGLFTTLGGVARNRIGRLNADGSLDTTFDPNAGLDVYAIAVQPDGKILVGGWFASIGGVARSNIARLNADGTVDAAFNPVTNNVVQVIAVQADGKVLIGGQFTLLGGAAHERIGRLNADGSLDASFNADADSTVESIVVQPDGKILVVGWFEQLGGTPRSRIGRLNPNGGLDSRFNFSAPLDGNVFKVAAQPDGKVLAVGAFSNMGAVTRSRIARLTADGRVETTFNPGTSPNGTVFALAVQPDAQIVAGGLFTSLGGATASRIGRVVENGSSGCSTFSGADDIVFAAAVQPDDKFVVGGLFTTLNGTARARIGRINSALDISLDAAFNPAATGTVAALAVQPDGQIIAAGGFTMLGGSAQLRIGRLHADGALDSFFGAADGVVNTMALQPDGRILVGGNFLNLNVPRLRIGRFESNGLTDTTFNPGADDQVFALALQADGKILVGGAFTTLAGAARAGIGRLNPDGSIDASFNPGASGGAVHAFAVQADGTILVGGAFTTLGGATRNRIGRLLASGAIDPSFNPGVNGQVYAFVVQGDGKILVGGPFTGLGGGTGATLRQNIGRLTNTTAASQSLSTSPGGNVITWLRGGASPEVSRVSFDISSNGVAYTALGVGTRIAGGWRLSGQAPPIKQNVFIRARGYYATGYHNGSESIVESVRNVFLAHTAFTDDDLTAGLSVIKAVHITELRTRINAVRVRESLLPFAYTNSAIAAGSSVVTALDVTELRTALAEVYTALGMTPPTYATSPAQGVTVRVADVASLRTATGAIE